MPDNKGSGIENTDDSNVFVSLMSDIWAFPTADSIMDEEQKICVLWEMYISVLYLDLLLSLAFSKKGLYTQQLA